MTGIFIQNEESIAQIVTQKYGCSFKANVYDNDAEEYVYTNISASEIIEPVDDFSTDVTNNQDIGDTDIELDTVDGLEVSDRLRIGNYIYYVKNIVNNVITINPLLESLSGDTATRVGNLGIYTFKFTFENVGTFTLIAKDSVFGINSTQIIKVQPKSIESMVNDIKNLEYAILGS